MENQEKIIQPSINQDQSPTIGELVKALSKTQGELKDAVKSSENPFYKSKYADLTSVWEACREQLSKNELAVIQTMAGNGGDHIIIVTTLAHKSGEWIRGHLCVKPVKNDPQGIGSAITYARRYSLAAIVGIAPAGEDDDAEKAMGRDAKKKTVKPPKLSVEEIKLAGRMYNYLLATFENSQIAVENAIKDIGKKLQIPEAEDGKFNQMTGDEIRGFWQELCPEVEKYEGGANA